MGISMSALVICSQNVEEASAYIPSTSLAGVIAEVTSILLSSVASKTYGSPNYVQIPEHKYPIEHSILVDWTSKSQANFRWMCSFAHSLMAEFCRINGFYPSEFMTIQTVSDHYTVFGLGEFTRHPFSYESQMHRAHWLSRNRFTNTQSV